MKIRIPHLYSDLQESIHHLKQDKSLVRSAQALDFRKPLTPGAGVEIAHGFIREAIPHATTDHYFKGDISRAVKLLQDRSMVREVEEKLADKI